MKRLAGVLIVVFFLAGHAYATERGSIPAMQQPTVKEVTGTGTLRLEAALYPEFKDPKPESVTIDGIVYETDPGCRSPFTVFTYLNREGQKITDISPTTQKGVAITTNGSALNVAMPSLQPTDLSLRPEVPAPYRKTAKILVAWTLRIEGECPNWVIGHYICEPWNGIIGFVCPKGDVKTFLKAKYTNASGASISKTIGEAVTMEIPRGSVGPVPQQDPTLTGAYVITADDFQDTPDQQIPPDLELQIYWENFTSLRLISPDRMRNMIINVIPYSKKTK